MMHDTASGRSGGADRPALNRGIRKNGKLGTMRNDMRDWYVIARIALLSGAAIWLLLPFGR